MHNVIWFVFLNILAGPKSEMRAKSSPIVNKSEIKCQKFTLCKHKIVLQFCGMNQFIIMQIEEPKIYFRYIKEKHTKN